MSPARTMSISSHAISMFALGLLIKVHWGGYGHWPTIDFPFSQKFA